MMAGGTGEAQHASGFDEHRRGHAADPLSHEKARGSGCSDGQLMATIIRATPTAEIPRHAIK